MAKQFRRIPMKVVILAPDEKLPSGNDPRARIASGLPEILREAGIEFTIHPVPLKDSDSSSGVPLETLKEIYDVYNGLEGTDLVHNLVGIPALLLAAHLKVPILTTFCGPPDGIALALANAASPRRFFNAVDAIEIPEGVHFLETFRTEKMAAQIPVLYEKIHALTRREDQRPWGYYVVLSDEPDHKVKRIVVRPGKRLSLQRHRRRSEHWHVVQGKALVTLNGQQIPLEAGESVDIPRGAAHRIQNPGKRDNLVFIEVQRGDYFGEDDIERLEDDYGRA